MDKDKNDIVYKNRWRALLFICVSLMVISLDNTVLNVALPSIANQLGATASDLQWIVDAYILVFASLLLTMGSIGDRFGRKRALQFGLIWFGLGSAAAGLSGSTGMLIVTRALLGIGGATIMPATLSIVTATFRDHKERAQAIAIWAAVFGLGVGVGPIVGGWLLERFHWNSVFFINLPVVAVALIGGYYFISDSKDEHAPKPDIPGVFLSITGLFSLVYGIIQAGQEGWTNPTVLLSFGVAAVLLTIFSVWEWRAPHAMLPLGFFKNMSFTGANTALALVTFSLFGSIFFMSQFFQSVQGYTALEAGILVLPMALVLMVFAALSARVSGWLGTKVTVGIGILFAAAGLFIMSQVATVDVPYSSMLFGLCVMSIGMGTAMSPATNSIMGSVPVRKAGVGSAMNDTTRQLGGALGVAVLGTIMNNTYIAQVASLKDIPLMAMVPPEAMDAINKSIQAAHIVAERINIPILSNTITGTADAAFVAGMKDAMLIGSVIMVAAALWVFAFLPAEVRRSEDVDEAPEAAPVPTQETVPAPVGD